MFVNDKVHIDIRTIQIVVDLSLDFPGSLQDTTSSLHGLLKHRMIPCITAGSHSKSSAQYTTFTHILKKIMFILLFYEIFVYRYVNIHVLTFSRLQ